MLEEESVGTTDLWGPHCPCPLPSLPPTREQLAVTYLGANWIFRFLHLLGALLGTGSPSLATWVYYF